jgi:N-acetylmuramic acid 6-phosphate etherase
VTEPPEGEDPTHTSPASNRRWEALSTEARHPASGELDRMSGERIVDLLLDEDRRALEQARRHGPSVAEAARWLAESFTSGGTVLFAGAGTSGRLGVLEAAECPPTFGSDPQRIRAVIAGGPEAVFEAREGAEDSLADGRQAAETLAPGDLLVGVSASSVTPFVRGALDQAAARGARTVLVTCAAGATVAGAADLVLALDTGPEVLTGSTRLKAGSVTKAVLNAMTTAAMVLAGKVFDNLMVDLRPGSAKLVDRSLRIIQAAAGVGRQRAESLYRAADGEVKTAIVMARCGIEAGEARQRLAEVGGHVRRALDKTPASPRDSIPNRRSADI